MAQHTTRKTEMSGPGWSTALDARHDAPRPELPRLIDDEPLAHASRGDGRATLRAPFPVRGTPGSVTERWAMLMLNTIHAELDPKTVGIWARAMGVSRSALCECCRLVRVSPHDARDFGRLMRAIHRSGPVWQPEALLDLADARTLKKLLDRAGLPKNTVQTPSPLEFLECQQWIPQHNPGLTALRALLIKVEELRHAGCY